MVTSAENAVARLVVSIVRCEIARYNFTAAILSINRVLSNHILSTCMHCVTRLLQYYIV